MARVIAVDLRTVASDAHRLEIPELVRFAAGEGMSVIYFPRAPRSEGGVVRLRESDSTPRAPLIVLEDFLEPNFRVRRHKPVPGTWSS
jgi:hypothetical protein